MAIFDDTRSDWNARPPTRDRTVVPWPERTGVSWHWIGDGKGPSGDHSKCLAKVRAWQGQHQDPKGRLKAKDIGYNALICQHGRAIEGRGLNYSGSHSPGVNRAHLGVQFMVGSGDPQPSAAMLARAVKLRADIAELAPNLRRDWAHRDDPQASTACPGNWIATWAHTGGPTKKPSSGSGGGSSAPIPVPKPPQQEEEDMPSAQEIADAVWAKQLPKPGNDKTQSAGSQLAAANVFAYRAANAVDVDAIVRALVAVLPKDATVNVNDLARAIVVELGKDN